MLAANGTAVVGESNEKRLEVGVGDGDERTVLLADFRGVTHLESESMPAVTSTESSGSSRQRCCGNGDILPTERQWTRCERILFWS